MKLMSYAEGRWHEGRGTPAEVRSAITGDVIALVNSDGLDMAAILRHARKAGSAFLQHRRDTLG
jgi:oxepin-CoA hydrolase / 3-oxo-5,6-dehydrosuberyl-CoA semialdehyde dehydrogenase